MKRTERAAGEQLAGNERAFRYGWEMRESPMYSGRSWKDIELALKTGWETRYHDEPWEQAALYVRDAWEGTTAQGSDEADRRRFDEERGTSY